MTGSSLLSIKKLTLLLLYQWPVAAINQLFCPNHRVILLAEDLLPKIGECKREHYHASFTDTCHVLYACVCLQYYLQS